MDTINLQVIRESFGRVTYSHKTHEKEAEKQKLFARWVKWINILLLTVASGSLLINLIADRQKLLVVGTIVATLELGFAIFQLSFDPAREEEKHRYTANLLWSIRERYVNLMADIRNNTLAQAEIVRQRDGILRELDLIYKAAPPTSKYSYKKAQKALKIEEELTFSDKEIKQFLPSALHLTEEDQ